MTDIDNDMEAMKRKLLETAESIKNDGVNLAETPIIFSFSFPESPELEFQLLIKELDLTEEQATEADVVH